MTLGHLHRWSLTGSITLAALGTVSGSSLLAGASALLVLAMLLTGGQLHDTERGSLRAWLVHGITVLVLVWAVSIGRSARIDSVVLIVLLGLFNRFVLRQGLRDDLILLGGAAVLLAVSTTITPGIAFLPTFVGFVWMSYGALRSAQIIGLAETEPEPRRRSVRRALLNRRAPGGLMKLALVAMLFIFFGYVGLTLFPKHRFARFLGAGSFMTLPGASDSMRLTNNGVGAGQDGTVVLRVTRYDDGESSLAGLYARLYSLDVFDGRQWKRETRPALFPIVSEDTPPADPSSRERVHVVLHRLDSRYGAHPVIALGRRWPARLLEIEERARTSLDGTWFIGLAVAALSIEYGFDLGEPAPEVRLPRSAERALRARWLQLPDGLDPRVTELARSLTASAATAADKIRGVLGHFSSGYTYSLEPIPGRDEDPLARFLFEARQGHCELYAGAVAALLRVAGVPARVVTGYYGGWYNSTGQALEFTEQDAHAWVEAYDPDRGWIWVDATPAGERARRRTKAWAWIRDFYDTLEALWFTNVVDFDEAKRRALLDRMVPDEWRASGAELLGGGGFEEVDRGRAAPWLLALGLAVAVVFGGATLLVRRREGNSVGRRLRRALDPDADPALPLGRLLAGVPARARGEAESVVRAYDRWRFAEEGVEHRPPPSLVRSVGALAKRLAEVRRLERRAR